jgi:hypothetical protein
MAMRWALRWTRSALYAAVVVWRAGFLPSGSCRRQPGDWCRAAVSPLLVEGLRDGVDENVDQVVAGRGAERGECCLQAGGIPLDECYWYIAPMIVNGSPEDD